MRCVYCRKPAGLVRRQCEVCTRIIAIIERTAGEVGLGGLVDVFAAEGLTREQVNRVLDAEIGGQPTIRDRLTSRMANVLMRHLGMPGRQSPEDVQRVRLRMGEGTSAPEEKPPGAA
jgi:hypothetical protein